VETRFGAFTFDDAARELRWSDQVIHLSPKAFELLGLLLRQRPNAVAKADLHSQLWPDTIVSDGSLAVLVTEIRRAIGDSARRPSFLRTVNRFGYVFVGAAVNSLAGVSPAGCTAASCSVTWGSERARLKYGENVLGRDPEADVCIEGVGVSRRHAVIIVGEDGVELRDLASKNGTFADGVRVLSPVYLLDNAEIRVGALSLRFHRSGTSGLTQTLEESPGLRGPS
jgi:DNA-binding winged helix-turn-helix (wHTH) protein